MGAAGGQAIGFLLSGRSDARSFSWSAAGGRDIAVSLPLQVRDGRGMLDDDGVLVRVVLGKVHDLEKVALPEGRHGGCAASVGVFMP